MSSNTPSVLSFSEPYEFDRQIDRILDEALCELEARTQDWVPASNTWEDENGFYIQMALPGWEPAEISLEVKGKVLSVKGERSHEDTHQYHLHEIGEGNFLRLFTLPAGIDHEKARAAHGNGLLTISFPKWDEAKARRILIEAA